MSLKQILDNPDKSTAEKVWTIKQEIPEWKVAASYSQKTLLDNIRRWDDYANLQRNS